MNFTERIKSYIRNILHQPTEYQHRLDRFLRFQFYFWPMVTRRLWRHNPMSVSAALSYQTIFAMIPVLVLTVLFMKAFGVVEDTKTSLRDLLKNAGFSQIYVLSEIPTATASGPTSYPTTSAQVTLSDKIEEIYDRVENKITLGSLGPVSILLLIWTALTLLTTMEQSLNHIFGAGTNRPLAKRMMLYWSAMTLAPLLFLGAGYISRSALSASEKVLGLSWLMLKVTQWGGPIFIGIVLMATLYKFLPNTSVPKRTAILGAIVAAPLWLAAKWAFGLYVKHAATTSFYGAAGLIPVFLFWLYISWLIFLLGAEIAYTAANLGRLRLAEEDETISLGPADLLAGTIVVARAFLSGQAPIPMEAIQQHIRLPDFTLHRLLNRLTLLHIVASVQTQDPFPSYTLARPADQITLPDILEISASSDQRLLPPDYYGFDISSLVESVFSRMRQTTNDLTLAQILSDYNNSSV